MREPPDPRIAPARSADDIAAAGALFRAYAASLPMDLAYQDFDAELAGLPGAYAPPGGELIIGRDPAGRPVGCVALRPLGTDGLCEMKRLYVAPEGRGTGLGRTLVEAVIATAEAAGYREMRLDTIPTLTVATALYKTLGFEIIEPYYDTPIAGTLFLSRLLGAQVAK